MLGFRGLGIWVLRVSRLRVLGPWGSVSAPPQRRSLLRVVLARAVVFARLGGGVFRRTHREVQVERGRGQRPLTL